MKFKVASKRLSLGEKGLNQFKNIFKINIGVISMCAKARQQPL
jgi:hypothetical protein